MFYDYPLAFVRPDELAVHEAAIAADEQRRAANAFGPGRDAPAEQVRFLVVVPEGLEPRAGHGDGAHLRSSPDERGLRRSAMALTSDARGDRVSGRGGEVVRRFDSVEAYEQALADGCHAARR